MRIISAIIRSPLQRKGGVRDEKTDEEGEGVGNH